MHKFYVPIYTPIYPYVPIYIRPVCLHQTQLFQLHHATFCSGHSTDHKTHIEMLCGIYHCHSIYQKVNYRRQEIWNLIETYETYDFYLFYAAL